MNGNGLCMGILLKGDTMEIGTLDHGRIQMITLPSSPQGHTILKARLRALGRPVRLAICGSAAVSLALALSTLPVGDVFIVTPAVADQSITLAHYAGRAI